MREKSQEKKIRKDIEEIYNQAMQNKNFSVALRAKELLGKEWGLFQYIKKELDVSNALSELTSQLSFEDLQDFVKNLEAYITLSEVKK